MKNKMKKIFCSILATVMLLSVFHANAAQALKSNERDVIDSSVFETYENGTHVKISCEDYSNGDGMVTVYFDGEIASTTYLNRKDRILTTVLQPAGGGPADISVMDLSIYERPAESVSALPGGFTYAGGIEYTYGNGSDTRTADIGYRIVSEPTHYNITGTYKTIGGLIGFLATVLGIAFGPAQAIAYKICVYLGVVVSTNFVIPDYIVDSTKYTKTWRSSWHEAGGLPAELTAIKHVVTGEHGGDTYYSGMDYDRNPVRDHDFGFADTIYTLGWWAYDESRGTVNRWI